MIFHMEATLLTTSPMDLNKITMSDWGRIGHSCTCEKASWQESHPNTSSYENVPIDEPFAKYCYERDSSDCLCPFSQALLISSSLPSCHEPSHCGA